MKKLLTILTLAAVTAAHASDTATLKDLLTAFHRASFGSGFNQARHLI